MWNSSHALHPPPSSPASTSARTLSCRYTMLFLLSSPVFVNQCAVHRWRWHVTRIVAIVASCFIESRFHFSLFLPFFSFFFTWMETRSVKLYFLLASFSFSFFLFLFSSREQDCRRLNFSNVDHLSGYNRWIRDWYSRKIAIRKIRFCVGERERIYNVILQFLPGYVTFLFLSIKIDEL